ncbi:hypothetical protein Q9L58_010238, partial [Maublancomyces gigas]
MATALSAPPTSKALLLPLAGNCQPNQRTRLLLPAHKAAPKIPPGRGGKFLSHGQVRAAFNVTMVSEDDSNMVNSLVKQ